MNNAIYPCLWFDGKAKEAAAFYCDIFSNSKIIFESPLVVNFEIEGKKIMGLNGGPMFTINPSISLFVTCDNKEEIESYWNKLTQEGQVLMALNTYPWSEKYGWVKDKYGMTWQLMTGGMPPGGQKIFTSFLFVNEQYGNALPAIEFYTAVFPGSKTLHSELYKAGEEQPAGKLKFGHFILNGELFAAMDGTGNHTFCFNEAVSLVVACKNQEEIDYYWNQLTAGGGKEIECGWLTDKYGVSWQIIPANLENLMSDPEKSKRVMQVVLKSKKLKIRDMENA